MKNLTFLLILFLGLYSCSNSTDKPFGTDGDISAINTENLIDTEKRLLLPEEFQAKMASIEKYHLIDVRTPEELAENGTIEGSINIDFKNANFEEQIKKLNKGIPIFIFCRSGGRSQKACAELNGYGFENVYDLDGGYEAWLQKNKKSL